MNDHHLLIQLLPSDLQRRIIYYLNSTDAISLTTSKILIGQVNVTALHPILVPSLHVYGHHETGDRPQPYIALPRIKLCSSNVSNIHSISIRAQWKDQGWGNHKGMFCIVARKKRFRNSKYDSELSILDQDISKNENLFKGGRVVTVFSTAAPHDWEDIELSFRPVDDDDDACIEVYELWYSVGSGGGHELFVKDVTVHTYYFDNHHSTYQKVYDCLYNVGCIGSTTVQPPVGERHAIRPTINASYLFYPNMILTICKSMMRQINTINVINDTEQEMKSFNNNEYLEPLIKLLREYKLLPNLDSLCAIEEFIQTEIDEWNLDWDIYDNSDNNDDDRIDDDDDDDRIDYYDDGSDYE